MNEQSHDQLKQNSADGVNHVTLTALQQFHCIGTDCPHSCCRINWHIQVDPDTLARWRQLDGEAGSDENLMAHVKRFSNAAGEHDVVTKNADASCSLLDPQGLCRVQKQHGHDYLPQTCREFPRVFVDDGIVSLRSASLACPEIVRLALFSRRPEEGESMLQTDRDSVFAVAQRVTGDAYANIKRVTADFLHRVMQRRAVPLNLRLFFIAGSFSRFHHELAQQGFTPRLAETHFKTRFHLLSQIAQDHKAGTLQSNPVTAGSYWKTIADLLVSRQVTLDVLQAGQAAQAPLVQLLDTGSRDPAYFEKLYTEIETNRDVYGQRYAQRYAKVFEDYMVLSFLNRKFPFNQHESNLLASLVMVLTVVAAIQLLIWMLLSAQQELDEALLQRIIYNVESQIGHTDAIFKTLSKDPHMLQLERYAEVYLDLF